MPRVTQPPKPGMGHGSWWQFSDERLQDFVEIARQHR